LKRVNFNAWVLLNEHSAELYLYFGRILACFVLSFPRCARAAFREHYFVLYALIVEIGEVYASASIEKDVSCTAYDLVFVGAL